MYISPLVLAALVWWISSVLRDVSDEYPEGYIETYYHNLDTDDIYQ